MILQRIYTILKKKKYLKCLAVLNENFTKCSSYCENNVKIINHSLLNMMHFLKKKLFAKKWKSSALICVD